MQIITLLEIILICAATIYLLNHYSAKDVPLYVKVIVFISWFCCFLGIVLVPLDVYYTLQGTEGQGLEQKNNEYKESFETIKVVWEVVYWTSFIFTWVILPVLQEYVDAGEFTPKEKMKKSLKVNLIIYGAMGGLGVLFIIYLSLTGKVGDQGIVQFLITFSNCFGIFLIIICLGFGLVHIPKRHFQQMDKEVNLRVYQYQAAVVDEQKSNLQFDLEELIKLIHLLSARRDIKIEHKALLSQILSSVPEQMVIDAKQTMSNTNHIIANEYGSLTHSKIISLNRQVKKKVAELRRNENKWEMILQKAFFLEDIMESKHSIDWRIRSAFYIERKGKCGRFIDTIEWIWYVKLEQIFHFIFGILFVCFSIGVFFSETFTFDNSHFFSFKSLIQSEDGFTKSQILCLIPLCYISLCVYSALFNMKLAGLYGLYPHHQTDAPSLLFAAVNFSRVSSPLVFNFLQMMKLKGTAFNLVMGDVDIAYSFTTYFPLILVFLILCNAFDVYGRVLGWLGLNSFKFSDEFTDERIEEGKKLLYRARNNKERNFLTLNSTNLRNYHTYGARIKLADYYSLDMENAKYVGLNGSSTNSLSNISSSAQTKKSEGGLNPLSKKSGIRQLSSFFIQKATDSNKNAYFIHEKF